MTVAIILRDDNTATVAQRGRKRYVRGDSLFTYWAEETTGKQVRLAVSDDLDRALVAHRLQAAESRARFWARFTCP